MPHTNKPKTPGAFSNGFKPATFVNINLTTEQTKQCKEWEWDQERIDNSLHALLFDGFKITMRFDLRNQCFAAWLTPPQGHKWDGLILSGRGSTPTKALKQCLYIHYHALDANWGTVQDQPMLVIDD